MKRTTPDFVDAVAIAKTSTGSVACSTFDDYPGGTTSTDIILVAGEFGGVFGS